MRIWTEWESKRALGPDLPLPRELLTHELEAALEFVDETGPEVVAKSSGVAHKSERGLVRVGIDARGLREEFGTLAAAGDGRVLVAEMVRDAEYELIVGGMRDDVFGPFVAVGVGGIATEILRDSAFLLSPPSAKELDQALLGLSAAALLSGVRGRPPLNRPALHQIVIAVGRLLEQEPSVIEVDCNPVMVVRGEPIVVDALVTESDGRRL